MPILGYRLRFNSHNQYVDVIAQTGFFGLICYIAVLVVFAHLGWRLFNRLEPGFGCGYAAGVLGVRRAWWQLVSWPIGLCLQCWL